MTDRRRDASILVFLHGLESSPNGHKARWLDERYACTTPNLRTDKVVHWLQALLAGDVDAEVAQTKMKSAFDNSVKIAAAVIDDKRPDIVIGSSYGGAVLLELVNRGRWGGSSIYLAQAGLKMTAFHRHPASAGRAILIHGIDDDVVPVEHSERIVQGGGDNVELWRVEDGHRLSTILEDGTLARAIEALTCTRDGGDSG